MALAAAPNDVRTGTVKKYQPEHRTATEKAERDWQRPHDSVQNITNARESHSDEMHHRVVKYSLAMGIRMVCLLAMFLVDGWWKLIPILGAVVLPWFAVIIANGGGDTTRPDCNALLNYTPHRELTTDGDDPQSAVPETAPTAQRTKASGSVLQGEVVPDPVMAEPAMKKPGVHSPGTTGHSQRNGPTAGAAGGLP